MPAEERFCPICEQTTSEPVCPADGVSTVPTSAFDYTTSDVLLGRVFSGRYRIERVLGQGGFGRVYRATQLSMRRPVAVKTLHRELVRDRVQLRRFYQEARAASALTGPHVVRIHDFGVDDETGCPFIAMELLEGRSLRDLISDEAPLDASRAAALLEQVALALLDASEAGVVHRDLKPSNVLLVHAPGRPDFVKVLDFGVAKVVGGHATSEERLTATGTSLGTPLYMSPEQAAGEKVDSRSDFYSLGCILHELLVGEPPFEGEDRHATLMQHLRREPPRLEDVAPYRVPQALDSLHVSLLRKDPDERPASAQAMVRILGCVARNEPVDAAAVLEQDAERCAVERRRAMARTDASPPHVDALDETTADRGVNGSAREGARGQAAGAAHRKVRRSTPAGVPEDLSGDEGLPPTDLSVEEPGVRARQPRRKAALLAGAACGLLIAAALFFAFEGDEHGASASDPPSEPGEAAAVQGVAPPRPAAPGASETVSAEEGPAETSPTPGAGVAATEEAPTAPSTATDPPPARAKLVLASAPPGATVHRGESLLCVTPCDVRVEPSRAPEVFRLSLEGHKTEEIKLFLGAGVEVSRSVTLEAEAPPAVEARPARRKKVPASRAGEVEPQPEQPSPWTLPDLRLRDEPEKRP